MSPSRRAESLCASTERLDLSDGPHTVPPVLGDLRVQAVGGMAPDTPALPRDRIRPDLLAAGVVLPRYADDGWNLGLLHHGHSNKSLQVNWASTPSIFREPLRAALWWMVNAAPDASGPGDVDEEFEERGNTGRLLAYPGPATCHQSWHLWSGFARWLIERDVRRLADVTYRDFKAWAVEGQSGNTSEPGRRNWLVPLSRLSLHTQYLPEQDRLPKPPWTSRSMRKWLGEVPARGDNTTEPISTVTISPLLAVSLFYVDLYLAWMDGDSERREIALATWPSLDPNRPMDSRRPRGRLTQDDRSRLAGACLVVVVYLTGMRPSEVLSLTRGCATVVEAEEGTRRYEVYGTESKGVRDAHGRHITGGRRRNHPWVTIEPAHRALRVLEALAEQRGSDLLFATKPVNDPRRKRTGEALTARGGADRIASFITWANGLAPRNGHPFIPPCPGGAIALSRFRRTLAWHIVRQPGGEIALGVQYGHLRLVTGQGYAGRREAGLQDVIDLEEVALALDTIDEIHERRKRGEVISGPAAVTLEARLDESHEFLGQRRTDRDLKRLKGLPNLKVYDVPETMVVCVFRPATAACLDDEEIDNRRTPSLNRCVTGCANAARTGTHIEGLRRRIAETEADRDASPWPLAHRLDRRIQIWTAAVEAHEARECEAAAGMA